MFIIEIITCNKSQFTRNIRFYITNTQTEKHKELLKLIEGIFKAGKENQIYLQFQKKRQRKVSYLDQEEGSYGRVCLYITSHERESLIVVKYLNSQKSTNNIENTPYSKMQGDDHQSVGSSVVTRSKSRHLVVLNNLKKRVNT